MKANLKNILYLLAMLMIIAWAIIFLEFNKGGPVHVLPALAILLFVSVVLMGHNR